MINNFFKNKSINKLRYIVRWGGYDNTIIPKMIVQQDDMTENGNDYIPPNGGGFTSTGQTVTGIVPLSVNFSNTSTGDNLSWLWNFGDGGTSTQQSPTYTYQAIGNYTVLLTTTNNYGSDTKTGIVTVQGYTSDPPPEPPGPPTGPTGPTGPQDPNL